MVPIVSPIRFIRLASTGRNLPILATVEAGNGEQYDAFLKAPGRKEFTVSRAVNELVAAHCAAELKLPVCCPLVVEKSPDWIETLPDPELAQELLNSAEHWFGSTYAGSQWSVWSSGSKLSNENFRTGLAILAFDAFLDNGDRLVTRPNLLSKGYELRVIDHDMMFSFSELFVPPKPPWELGSLSWIGDGDRTHALFSELQGCKAADFQAVHEAWSMLDNQVLDAILSDIPPSWAEQAVRAQNALERIKSVRDNIDACIDELCRVLS